MHRKASLVGSMSFASCRSTPCTPRAPRLPPHVRTLTSPSPLYCSHPSKACTPTYLQVSQYLQISMNSLSPIRPQRSQGPSSDPLGTSCWSFFCVLQKLGSKPHSNCETRESTGVQARQATTLTPTSPLHDFLNCHNTRTTLIPRRLCAGRPIRSHNPTTVTMHGD